MRDWLFELSTVEDQKRGRGSQQWRLFGDNAFGSTHYVAEEPNPIHLFRFQFPFRVLHLASNYWSFACDFS